MNLQAICAAASYTGGRHNWQDLRNINKKIQVNHRV